MSKRTLSLKRETLSELSDADLAGVAGADQAGSVHVTCPVIDCVAGTYRICIPTERCPTLFC